MLVGIKPVRVSVNQSIHRKSLRDNVRFEWNAADQLDWPKIEHLFVNAYISAYQDCDLNELAIPQCENNDQSQVSKVDVLSQYFKHEFQAEKRKILSQDQQDPYRSHYLIARFHNQPIAFFVCQLNYKSGRTYLRWVTINPAFHHQGIGRAMLDEITKRFPQSKGLELYTRIANIKSKLFYEKCGFSQTNEFDFEEPSPDLEQKPKGYFTNFIHDWLDNRKLFPPLDEKISKPENFIGFIKNKIAK